MHDLLSPPPGASGAPHTVRLASATDLAGFRAHARALLAAAVPPADVHWVAPDGPGSLAAGDLFDTLAPAAAGDGARIAFAARQVEHGAAALGADGAAGGAAGRAAAFGEDGAVGSAAVLGNAGATSAITPGPHGQAPRVPADFLRLCAQAVLHADPGRFGLLYRLLWRLAREPGLWGDPLDADRMAAETLARAVRREVHKMRAFVRFRPVPGANGAEPLHVAWFEPAHHVVAANAPFFQRRFANLRWAILTPRGSVAWDGHALAHGPAARREDAPGPDAGESLWLTYYAHIFNPARLKLAAMQREMPRRYWPQLPEARLIAPLAAAARQRSREMVDAAPTTPARRIRPTVPIALLPAAPGDPRPRVERLGPALQAAADRCRACPIGAHATQAVVGEGPASARLVVVGEQPGEQEDLRGRPFVGPAGALFDRALAALGWPREQLYVTNAVKHFKFELRGQRRIHKTPHQQEVEACRHWLEGELALLRPRALVALGATAARALLGRPVAVLRERGQWHADAAGRPVLVTLHPSALLRSDPAQADADFQRWLQDLALASTALRG